MSCFLRILSIRQSSHPVVDRLLQLIRKCLQAFSFLWKVSRFVRICATFGTWYYPSLPWYRLGTTSRKHGIRKVQFLHVHVPWIWGKFDLLSSYSACHQPYLLVVVFGAGTPSFSWKVHVSVFIKNMGDCNLYGLPWVRCEFKTPRIHKERWDSWWVSLCCGRSVGFSKKFHSFRLFLNW